MQGADVVVSAFLPRDLKSWKVVKETLIKTQRNLIDACAENKIKLYIPSAYEP